MQAMSSDHEEIGLEEDYEPKRLKKLLNTPEVDYVKVYKRRQRNKAAKKMRRKQRHK